MSEKLIKALDKVRDMPDITLGKIVAHIEGEALLILCLVSIIPFMQPIPIPGISTLLGLIVVLQGIGLIFLGRPILTKRMKDFAITHERFELIYKGATKFSQVTSKLSFFKHPIVSNRTSQIICGIAVTFSAAFLSLPLPIPFSNFVPAASIFLICLGLLEEDVMMILIGFSITIAVIWMAMLSYGFIKEQYIQWSI